MLRAILRQRVKDGANGAVSESLHTIDFDNYELEEALTAGGCNETGYDITELMGVEIILPPRKNL
jgi:hypothetical protein